VGRTWSSWPYLAYSIRPDLGAKAIAALVRAEPPPHTYTKSLPSFWKVKVIFIALSQAMITPNDVAAWMLSEVMRQGIVYQKSMASDIELMFGQEFVPENENGNPSIRRDALKAFRKISENAV
jgi:hypothetical protein